MNQVLAQRMNVCDSTVDEKNARFFSIEMALVLLLLYPFIGVFSAAIGLSNNITAKFLSLDQWVVFAYIAIAIILNVKTVVQRIKVLHLLVLLFLAVFMVVALPFSKDIEVNISVMRLFFSLSIPALVLTSCCADYSLLQKNMLQVSYVLSAAIILATVLTAGDWGTIYRTSYLALGYASLTPFTFVATHALETKRLFPITLSCGLLVLLVLSGARGPLLCALIFVGIKLSPFFIKSNLMKLVYIIVLIALCALLAVNWNNLFFFLNEIADLFQFNKRILLLAEQGNLFNDSSRFIIYKEVLKLIRENFLLGVGPVNDRMLIKLGTNWIGNPIGLYPHNFFLEVLVQYGIILGGLLICLLVHRIWKRYSTSNVQFKNLLLCALTIGLFPLMVSSSYLGNMNFFFLLGILISPVTTKKHSE